MKIILNSFINVFTFFKKFLKRFYIFFLYYILYKKPFNIYNIEVYTGYFLIIIIKRLMLK